MIYIIANYIYLYIRYPRHLLHTSHVKQKIRAWLVLLVKKAKLIRLDTLAMFSHALSQKSNQSTFSQDGQKETLSSKGDLRTQSNKNNKKLYSAKKVFLTFLNVSTKYSLIDLANLTNFSIIWTDAT